MRPIQMSELPARLFDANDPLKREVHSELPPCIAI